MPNPTAPLTVVAAIDSHAISDPARIAVIDRGVHVTPAVRDAGARHVTRAARYRSFDRNR